MKTIGKIATALAVAFSALAFTATTGSADSGAPAIVPHGHYCASYTQAGIDCSFTSYAECEAMVSGESAECYGNTPADDQDPWGARRAQQERPFLLTCAGLLHKGRRLASPPLCAYRWCR